VGACVVFLFSGCATTKQVQSLEAELAGERKSNAAEIARLNNEISKLQKEQSGESGTQNNTTPVSTQTTSSGVQASGASAGSESVASLRAEIERLQLLNDILLEASNSVVTVKPEETSLTVGIGRIRVSPVVNNSGFLGFLSAENRPDAQGRASATSAQAVGVSWFEAARYCNWLSVQWQYDPYYLINETNIQINYSGRRNGYRLPSQAELDAIIKNGFLSMDAVSRTGLLSSEVSRAYRYDRTRNSLVAVDATLPVNNIGFMVVRNEN
jgi:hypothetical protein